MSLTDRHRTLLTTIINSRTFERVDEINGQLLMYLADHSSQDDHHLRTETALLSLAFLKHRNTARMSTLLARLQRLIDRYFAREGRTKDHAERPYINRGKDVPPKHSLHNAVLYRPNTTVEEATRRFWKPHLIAGRDSHIAYGLPLFTRKQHGEYGEVLTRRLSENFEQDTAERHPKERVCWPLVRLGDALCVMRLTKWLGERDVEVNTKWYRAGDRHYSNLLAPKENNVIVVGAPRVNGVFAVYQSTELRFRMDADVVFADLEGQTTERLREKKSKGMTIVPTLVTRTGGRSSGAVTMIASPHGQAVDHLSEVLTSESMLVELFQHPKLQGWADRLPDQFQILLGVTVLDDELAAPRHEVVDAWWNTRT